MPVAAYMISILARQRAELDWAFSQRYPDAWLVWEPGPWRPALSAEARDLFSTDPPDKAAPPRPPGEDAICYQLPAAEPRRQLSVGRASGNDVVLNDATASRQQLVLEAGDDGDWRVAVTRGEVTLQGQRLGEGWTPLHTGDCLTIGELRLTYYGPGALEPRLTAARPHLAAP